MRWKLVMSCVSFALVSCGGDSPSPRDEALGNLHRSAGYENPSAALTMCFEDLLRPFTDAEIADALANGGAEFADAMNNGFPVCVAAEAAQPITTSPLGSSGDPELDRIAADPMAWMQEKWNTVTQGLCNNQPELFDSVFTSDSTNLATLRADAQTGTVCPTVTVLSVRTNSLHGSGASPLDSLWLTPGVELQFYVTDAGWSGDNHEWSIHVLQENGVWKIQSRG